MSFTRDLILARGQVACICKGIKMTKVMKAINAGAGTYTEIARKTGIGGGECGGQRCREKVRILLQEKKLSIF